MSRTVLMVLTSHDRFEAIERPTGWWLEEVAVPYLLLREAGVEVTIASPAGGKAPMDPASAETDAAHGLLSDFLNDREAMDCVNDTIPLGMVRAEDYDALFFPGGHGPMFDLSVSEEVAELVADFIREKKPVAAVCHGPAALLLAADDTGSSVIEGRRITGFSNEEETAAGLHEAVPFLLQESLIARGAEYVAGPPWQPHVLEDGPFITGQNPASSMPLAQALLRRLGIRRSVRPA